MANWCSNYVEFAFFNSELEDELKQIKERYVWSCAGQYPIGCNPDEHYANLAIFEPLISPGGTILFFLTRWSPAIGTMTFLSDKYKVPFKMEWVELGCKVAGIAEYDPEDGIWIKEWDGDDSDISEDQDSGTCEYKGNVYETKEDAIFAKLKGE